jgi:hypothetical protein
VAERINKMPEFAPIPESESEENPVMVAHREFLGNLPTEKPMLPKLVEVGYTAGALGLLGVAIAIGGENGWMAAFFGTASIGCLSAAASKRQEKSK